MMRNMSDADATLEQLVSDNDALRRQLAQAQERIAALEAENARQSTALRAVEATLESKQLFWRDAIEQCGNDRDTARRAAAARLRAVKRMRKIAESYRPHALQHRSNYKALMEFLDSTREQE